MESVPGHNLPHYQGVEKSKCEHFQVLSLNLAIKEETLVRRINEEARFKKEFLSVQEYYRWLLDLLAVTSGEDKDVKIEDRLTKELSDLVQEYQDRLKEVNSIEDQDEDPKKELLEQENKILETKIHNMAKKLSEKNPQKIKNEIEKEVIPKLQEMKNSSKFRAWDDHVNLNLSTQAFKICKKNDFEFSPSEKFKKRCSQAQIVDIIRSPTRYCLKDTLGQNCVDKEYAYSYKVYLKYEKKSINMPKTPIEASLKWINTKIGCTRKCIGAPDGCSQYAIYPPVLYCTQYFQSECLNYEVGYEKIEDISCEKYASDNFCSVFSARKLHGSFGQEDIQEVKELVLQRVQGEESSADEAYFDPWQLSKGEDRELIMNCFN